MKIITDEGKIVEGVQMTDENAAIFSELCAEKGPIDGAVPYRVSRAEGVRFIATNLIKKYNITLRIPAVPEGEEF